MEISQAIEFVRTHKFGALATQRRDGRPQLSNIVYFVDDEGVIRASITETRVKTRNMRRDPRVSLYVTAPDFWTFCVLDCDAVLMPVAKDPDDATADALVEYYRAVSGEHPDWDDYREAMVSDQRLIVSLTPTHAYGMVSR